jgi:hypothetical protein
LYNDFTAKNAKHSSKIFANFAVRFLRLYIIFFFKNHRVFTISAVPVVTSAPGTYGLLAVGAVAVESLKLM